MKYFKLIIAGGRDFYNISLLDEKISKITAKKKNVLIVCGGAKGADSLGANYALKNDLPIAFFIPDWELHGKKAGYLRNMEMANNADACIAFWDGKSKGTSHMINICKKKFLQHRVIKDNKMFRFEKILKGNKTILYHNRLFLIKSDGAEYLSTCSLNEYHNIPKKYRIKFGQLSKDMKEIVPAMEKRLTFWHNNSPL